MVSKWFTNNNGIIFANSVVVYGNKKDNNISYAKGDYVGSINSGAVQKNSGLISDTGVVLYVKNASAGFVVENSGAITNCYVNGVVQSRTKAFNGGNNGKVYNCYTTIKATESTFFEGTTVSDCFYDRNGTETGKLTTSAGVTEKTTNEMVIMSDSDTDFVETINKITRFVRDGKINFEYPFFGAGAYVNCEYLKVSTTTSYESTIAPEEVKNATPTVSCEKTTNGNNLYKITYEETTKYYTLNSMLKYWIGPCDSNGNYISINTYKYISIQKVVETNNYKLTAIIKIYADDLHQEVVYKFETYQIPNAGKLEQAKMFAKSEDNRISLDLLTDVDYKKAGITRLNNNSANYSIYIKNFEGNGFTISGIQGGLGGFFSNVSESIKNCTFVYLSESCIETFGAEYLGAVADYVGSSIENVTVEGATITGSATHIGGVAGYVGSSIENVINKIDIGTSNNYVRAQYVGGVAGLQEANYITDAINYGNIYATSNATKNYVGGIIGNCKGHIKKSFNYGAIEYSIETKTSVCLSDVGGIVGQNSQGNIGGDLLEDRVGNYGNINASNANYVGGIAGRALRSQMQYAFNLGNVEGKCAGGIAGLSGSTLNYTYNYATVTASEYGGGIAGSLSENISNSKNFGKVEAKNSTAVVGGIVGSTTLGIVIDACSMEGKLSTNGTFGWIIGGKTSGDPVTIINCYVEASDVYQTVTYNDEEYQQWATLRLTNLCDNNNNLKVETKSKNYSFVNAALKDNNLNYSVALHMDNYTAPNNVTQGLIYNATFEFPLIGCGEDLISQDSKDNYFKLNVVSRNIVLKCFNAPNDSGSRNGINTETFYDLNLKIYIGLNGIYDVLTFEHRIGQYLVSTDEQSSKEDNFENAKAMASQKQSNTDRIITNETTLRVQETNGEKSLLPTSSNYASNIGNVLEWEEVAKGDSNKPEENNGVVKIATAHELAYVAAHPSYYSSKMLILKEEIDLTGYVWRPMSRELKFYKKVLKSASTEVETTSGVGDDYGQIEGFKDGEGDSSTYYLHVYTNKAYTYCITKGMIYTNAGHMWDNAGTISKKFTNISSINVTKNNQDNSYQVSWHYYEYHLIPEESSEKEEGLEDYLYGRSTNETDKFDTVYPGFKLINNYDIEYTHKTVGKDQNGWVVNDDNKVEFNGYTIYFSAGYTASLGESTPKILHFYVSDSSYTTTSTKEVNLIEEDSGYKIPEDCYIILDKYKFILTGTLLKELNKSGTVYVQIYEENDNSYKDSGSSSGGTSGGKPGGNNTTDEIN